MLILTAAEVRQALPMREAIEAIKGGYAALSDGRAEVPLRARLPIAAHDALSLFMPAFIDSNGIASTRDIVSIARSRNSGRQGAKPKPQFPTTIEVTPCQPFTRRLVCSEL